MCKHVPAQKVSAKCGYYLLLFSVPKKLVLLYVYVYECFAYIYVSMPHAFSTRVRDSGWSPLGWEPNLGPLQVQSEFLTLSYLQRVLTTS